MSMHYVMPEDSQTRLERAHAALEFVGDLLGELETVRGALGKATGTAPAAQRMHAEVHAGGMAQFCHLVSDELRAVLETAEFHTDEGRDDE